MADTISYIKVGDENHPIDAITVNGITLTSAEKTVWNNKQDALTFDSIPTENSGNPITSGGIYTIIKDNEYVIAAAINDINTRLTNVESGGGSGSGSGITSESDPRFASSPAAGITAADISNWRSMSSGSGITSESDPVFAASVAASITASDISNWNSKTSNTGTLTGVKFNGTNATVSNGVASISVTIPAAQVQSDWNATTGVSAIKNKPTIPAAVTEATVSGWGFTKNTGTLTTHASHKLTATNNTATAISQGTEITFIESLSGTTTATSGNLTVTATRKKVTIPTAVTEATVSNWGFTKNTGTLTSESDPVFAASVAASITASDISNWNSKTSNTGTLTGVKFNGTNATVSNGVASITATIPTVNDSTITIQKNGTNVDSFTTNVSSNKSINITVNELPELEQGDSGKFLFVNFDSQHTPVEYWDKTDIIKYTSGHIQISSNIPLYLTGSVGITVVDTAGINKPSHSNWSWISTGTGSTYKTLQSDLDAIRQLPAVSSTDNGKILQVVNGQWTLVSPVNIYSGNGSPNNSQGVNGDLYLQTS